MTNSKLGLPVLERNGAFHSSQHFRFRQPAYVISSRRAYVNLLANQITALPPTWKIKPFYVMWKMPESQTEKSGSMDSAPGVLVHALPRKKGTLGYPQSRRKNASSNFFVEHSLCLNNQIVFKNQTVLLWSWRLNSLSSTNRVWVPAQCTKAQKKRQPI